MPVFLSKLTKPPKWMESRVRQQTDLMERLHELAISHAQPSGQGAGMIQ